jgi:hypothetical protein
MVPEFYFASVQPGRSDPLISIGNMHKKGEILISNKISPIQKLDRRKDIVLFLIQIPGTGSR